MARLNKPQRLAKAAEAGRQFRDMGTQEEFPFAPCNLAQKNNEELVRIANRERHAVSVFVESSLTVPGQDSVDRWVVDGRLDVFRDDFWRVSDENSNSQVIFQPRQIANVIRVGSATHIELRPNGDLEL